MVHRRIHEDHQSHQEFTKSTSRLHEGHNSYQELIKQYMENSSWSSTFSRIYERVFNKVHRDHDLYLKFRKEYMEGFAKIINCTKDFESVYERVFDNHQSYWEFMTENIQGIKWITKFFLHVSQRIWKTFQFINYFKRVSEVVSRNFYFMDLTMYTRRLSKSSYKSYNRWTANRP
jgi:hypothetical protein